MKAIKKLIGNLTKPLVSYKYYGDDYVDCNGIPMDNIGGSLQFDYSGYSYQRIEQNFFGVWVKTEQYLKRQEPLYFTDENNEE